MKAQFHAVQKDLAIDAVKIGMLLNIELIKATAAMLEPLTIPKVIDPVMVSRTGAVLLEDRRSAYATSCCLRRPCSRPTAMKRC